MAEIISGKLQVEITGPDEVTVVHDMRLHVVDRVWEVNAGDRGDLSSYPVIGGLLYDPFEAALAGVWHDKRYQKGDCTRKIADRGWYEIAITGENENTRMPKWKARIGYCGLRAGGWVTWKKYRSADNGGRK